MTDALVDTISEYMKNTEISPGVEEDETIEGRPTPVTALTLPEPLKSNDENGTTVTTKYEIETVISNSAIINHKLNTAGIIYRDYISDSSDLNSDTSSLEDQQHQRQQQFRQSTGDLTLISKAVSIDTHNSSDVSSAVVPAQRNPVSDLLRSPASSTESEDEDTAMSEYYSAETLQNKMTATDVHSSDSLHRHHQQQQAVSLSTNNEPPPPPPSSSLKKVLLHYDHKVIPDEEEATADHVLPTVQPNVEPRFITMEEELEVNDYVDAGEDDELEGLPAPNNMSMVDLSLPVAEVSSPIKTEVRSLEQRRSIKRLNAIKELMETEESYSRDLGILCTVS